MSAVPARLTPVAPATDLPDPISHILVLGGSILWARSTGNTFSNSTYSLWRFHQKSAVAVEAEATHCSLWERVLPEVYSAEEKGWEPRSKRADAGKQRRQRSRTGRVQQGVQLKGL